MIELIVEDRCTACDVCVLVCPTNVFESSGAGAPVIARQEDCQTCFLCELYCPDDALYVAPDCEGPAPVDAAQIVASGLLGQYRRDSGWDEWANDPRYTNEHWRMEAIFGLGRRLAGSWGRKDRRARSAGFEYYARATLSVRWPVPSLCALVGAYSLSQ